MDKKHPGERLLKYNRKVIDGYITMGNKEQKEVDNINDHDLLIRVDERVERIDKWCFNHDIHHFRYNILAWSVALGAIVTLAIALIKVL